MKTLTHPWTHDDIKVQAGSRIYVETWGNACSSILQDCEIPEFAPFRLPSMQHTDIAYTCDIDITGRTPQRRHGDYVVRVKITWIHDGAPNEVSFGWMAI